MIVTDHVVRPQIKKRNPIRLLLLLSFSIILIIGGFTVFHTSKQIILPKKIFDVPTSTPTQPVLHSSQPLGNAIQNELIGTHGTYGIVVENLKTHENYYQNAQKIYKSGSLYKLWVMADVYEYMKEGKLPDTQILSKNVVDLNKEFGIDPDLAEKTSGTITYTVHDALYQMITISDNYAALLLADTVGLQNIATFLTKNGFMYSKVGMHGKDPITTPFDIALFFEKLYKGQLINADYSNRMLKLLKGQRLNDKIPEYLPVSVTVAHKTGELDNVTHDAGIIYAPDGDYILVVLSLIDDRQLANERIANVSKAVFNYFNPNEK